MNEMICQENAPLEPPPLYMSWSNPRPIGANLDLPLRVIHT